MRCWRFFLVQADSDVKILWRRYIFWKNISFLYWTKSWKIPAKRVCFLMMGQVDGQHDTWHQRHHWHLDNPCRRLNLLWSCGVSCQVVLFWVKKNGFSPPSSTPLSFQLSMSPTAGVGNAGFLLLSLVSYHVKCSLQLQFPKCLGLAFLFFKLLCWWFPSAWLDAQSRKYIFLQLYCM